MTTQADSPEETGTKSERLRLFLLELIDSELAPKDKLPTERELAERFAVSRMTVRQVLARIEADGLVYRVQGSGTFVREPQVSKALELTSFTADMRARGLTASSRVLSVELVPADTATGSALLVSPGDPLAQIRRVRLADGEPMAIEDAFIPLSLFPGIADLDVDGSLYELLENRYRVVVDRAEQSIRAEVLDPAEAALLNTSPFSPTIVVHRITQDQRGRNIEFTRSKYRADRYAFNFTVHRRPMPLA